MATDAPLYSTPLSARELHFSRQSDFRPQIAAGVVAVLLATGGLLFSRRFGGALSQDLPRTALLLLAVSATAAAACARIVWRRTHPFRAGQRIALGDRLIGWGSSLGLVLLAAGCSFPAAQTSDWLIWLPLLVVDQLWRQNFFDAGHPGSNDPSLSDAYSVTPLEPLALEALTAANQPSEQIVQQLFRVRDEQGLESIYGTLQAEFQPGQRTATLHVGFCPPLPTEPRVEAEPISGPAARVKIVRALAHGARLDVKLTAPNDRPCQVMVDMAATAPGKLA